MESHLKELLIRGEDDTLDYKQSISSASKIAKTMSSFANNKGGILLVGVRDNRSIAGVNSEDEKYMLDLAASFYCKPEIPIEIVEHEISGKLILECIVPEGEDKPYSAKGEDGKYWVYIRVKDKSLLASKIVVDVLRRQRAQKGTFIKYGKNENALLKYLEKNERITLNDFKKLVNISRWRASKILVNLISAGIIRNHTTEKTEYYTLA
ncbi:ATP-binding protein [bacterium]|nr:ATP-binding protein [bacterium]